MSLDGHSPPTGSGSRATRLLQAACELAGGERQLAQRLNMSIALLRRYMAGRGELPQQLLLRTMDLLLEERERRFPLGTGMVEAAGEQRRDGSDLPG